MKKYISILSAVVLVSILLSSCNTKQLHKYETTEIEEVVLTHEDTMAYIIGVKTGGNLNSELVTFEFDPFAKGVYDAMQGNDTLFMNEKQMEEFQLQFQQEMLQKQRELEKIKADTNRAQEKRFLAANGKVEGITTTQSGLQYKVITLGTGPKPSANDTVKVHYKGSLLDSTVFESSFESNPVEFPLYMVIPGWVEGVQLMPEGSTFEFYIPAELAYGEYGRPPVIPAASCLIFKIQLLEVK